MKSKRKKRDKVLVESEKTMLAVCAATLEYLNLDTIGRNACVLATRLLIDAFAQLKIECHPVPCIMSVRNAKYVAMEKTTGKTRPDDPEDAKEWQRQGAYEILLVDWDEKTKEPVPRHIVAAVKIRKKWFLIDLTANQTERPEFNIVDLGQIIAEVPEHVIAGGYMAESWCDTNLVNYLLFSFPDHHEWLLGSLDWERDEAYNRVAMKRIIGEAREFATMSFNQVVDLLPNARRS